MPHPVAFTCSAGGMYAVWSALRWIVALYLRAAFAEDDAGSGRFLID